MRSLFVAVSISSGCAGPATPDLVCPPPAPPELIAMSIPQRSAAVAGVIRHFDLASDRAIARVLQSDVSAEQIAAIRIAEERARKALAHLGHVLPRLDPAVMAEARAAVAALEDTLQ